MYMKTIQTNLLSAFESSGLTYDELSRRTNLPKSALYRYINGDTEKIPIDRFQAICSELHVDAGSLLGWNDSDSDTFRSVIVPDNKLFTKITEAMTPDEYRLVVSTFEKAYKRLKEKGEIE